VGKERVANALHAASGRQPFVAVNCAAIPKELMEAELFGAEKRRLHRRDEDTAWSRRTSGQRHVVSRRDRRTRGQTSAEASPFPRDAQDPARGGNAEIQSEVRVLSATNSNLEAEVGQGKFRSTLLPAIRVILHVPPLRARPEDIPQFAKAFLQAAGERAGKYFESAEPELIRKLKQYDWRETCVNSAMPSTAW